MKFFLALLLVLAFSVGRAQLRPGQSAPEIGLPGIDDSIVRLAAFRNKVVLIDFWASWCSPCRHANHVNEKLYKKYRDKGFEVIGVSTDVNRSEWLRAIKKDKVTYTQVNDKTGGYSPVLRKYGVYIMPTTFLVDKEGKIAGVDLEGDELENTIQGLL